MRKAPGRRRRQARAPELQWGRNLTVAEGRRAGRHHGQVLHTSMGPQLDSCGRGAGGSDPRANRKILQWGRNLTVAEGPNPSKSCPPCAPLQWGRNLTVAEGTAALVRLAQRAQTSMGPQLDSCGRGARRRRRPEKNHTSMGPQLDSCGRPAAASRSSAAQSARRPFVGSWRQPAMLLVPAHAPPHPAL